MAAVFFSVCDFALSLPESFLFVIYCVFVPVRQFTLALFIASLLLGRKYDDRTGGRDAQENPKHSSGGSSGIFAPAVCGKSEAA